uniref:Uncharacterized protein n=1 Tax=Glossina pallidipes TaxID=7398 RepID=A0A1A9Z6Y8_GLOPL
MEPNNRAKVTYLQILVHIECKLKSKIQGDKNTCQSVPKLTSGQNKTGFLRKVACLSCQRKTLMTVEVSNGQLKEYANGEKTKACSSPAFPSRNVIAVGLRRSANVLLRRRKHAEGYVYKLRKTMKFEAAFVVSCAQTRTGHLHNMEKRVKSQFAEQYRKIVTKYHVFLVFTNPIMIGKARVWYLLLKKVMLSTSQDTVVAVAETLCSPISTEQLKQFEHKRQA